MTAVKKAVMTEWMRQCPECVNLVEALNETDLKLTGPILRAWEEVRRHLVAEHLALLPGYFEDCANCQEWAALAAGEGDDRFARVAVVLGQEDLLHRAGHLLYEVPAARG